MKADGRALSTALSIARSQSDEAAVRPIDGGWEVHCMSPEGAAMCDVRILAGAFPEGTDGTPQEFTAELDRWLKALRAVGPEAEVAFEDGLIRVEGDGMRHTFRMLAPPEARNRFAVPDLGERLTGECMMETDRIRRLLASVDEKRVEDIVLSLGPEGLRMEAYDEALNGVDLTVPPDEAAVMEGSGTSRFSREMWATVMKVIPADAVIDIRLGTDVPCTVGFGDRTYDAVWLCAPKIRREGA